MISLVDTPIIFCGYPVPTTNTGSRSYFLDVWCIRALLSSHIRPGTCMLPFPLAQDHSCRPIRMMSASTAVIGSRGALSGASARPKQHTYNTRRCSPSSSI
eukprot:scaffold117331_cov33-Prasinocladus_malaysianus.AAC.2